MIARQDLGHRQQLSTADLGQAFLSEQDARRIDQVPSIAEHFDQCIGEKADLSLQIRRQVAINFPAGIRGQFVAAAQRILETREVAASLFDAAR